MKIINKTIIALLFLASQVVFTQNIQNINWERPSYEIDNYLASGLSSVTGKYSQKENKASGEFTPANDYYNSVNGLSVIEFFLEKPGFVNIKIYDEKGNTVDELARSSFGSGSHEIKWNSSKYREGSYYYSIITSEYSKTNKIK